MDHPSRRVSMPSEPHLSPSRPYQKRNRLTIACTQCRRRKVRCDPSLPRCRNCRLRGDKCETLDLREIDKDGSSSQQEAIKETTKAEGSVLEYVDDRNILQNGKEARSQGGMLKSKRKRTRKSGVLGLPASNLKSTASQVVGEHDTPTSDADVSWVTQAYRASAVESQCVAGSAAESNSGPTPDIVLNIDKSSIRTKFLGGSSVQSLCNFVDLHLAAIGLDPIGGWFNDGMQHSEEFSVPLLWDISAIALLPPREEISTYVKRFLKFVWPLFPVVDPIALESDISQLLTLQETYSKTFIRHLTPVQMTHLAIAYAVVCIGYDELNGRVTETSTRYLSTAYSLYAQLVAFPYVSSAQAFVLLSLAFRGQIKEGQAWQTLGQAIRIAHSIGLHKRAEQVSGTSDRVAGMDQESGKLQNLRSLIWSFSMTPGHRQDFHSETEILHSRIWYSCCALERVMQLESGRPSHLDGSHEICFGNILASGVFSATFASWLFLTTIMGRIASQVYFKRPATLLELLQRVQDLDQALMDWKSFNGNLMRIKPSDDEDHCHLNSILIMQYNFAHITLLRLAIMFPPNIYLEELSKHERRISSYSRLKDGAHFCRTAARETITEALHIADYDTQNKPGHSLLWMTVSPVFLSTIVLALGILQQPHRRVVRADLELLELATELFENRLSRWMSGGRGDNGESADSAQDKGFASIGKILHTRVSSYFRLRQSEVAVFNMGSDYRIAEGSVGVSPLMAHAAMPSYNDQRFCKEAQLDQPTNTQQAMLTGICIAQDEPSQIPKNISQLQFEQADPCSNQQRPTTATRGVSQPALFEGLEFQDMWDFFGSDLFLDEHSMSFV